MQAVLVGYVYSERDRLEVHMSGKLLALLGSFIRTIFVNVREDNHSDASFRESKSSLFANPTSSLVP